MTNTTKTLWEISSQMIVTHHMVQIINMLIWNIIVPKLLNSLKRLIVKSELPISLLVVKISSALLKLNIIYLICVFAVEHLKLLADLTVSWKLSLTIRILVYVFICSSDFHLTLDLLSEFFLLFLRYLNGHSLLFALNDVIVFSSDFLSVVVLLALRWRFLSSAFFHWTLIFAFFVNLVHTVDWRGYVGIIGDSLDIIFSSRLIIVLLDLISVNHLNF